MTEKQLITACKNEDRKAQRELYERYAPLMMSICRRYVNTKEDAEDILVEAFYKILTSLHQFREMGSFVGWMRRIVVNESLMFLRKRHNFRMTVEIDEVQMPVTLTIEDELAAKDITDLLQLLPTGYRTVFNLYVVEGFKHREIAELLGISINTSKSQLILAKKKLKMYLKEMKYPGVG